MVWNRECWGFFEPNNRELQTANESQVQHYQDRDDICDHFYRKIILRITILLKEGFSDFFFSEPHPLFSKYLLTMELVTTLSSECS